MISNAKLEIKIRARIKAIKEKHATRFKRIEPKPGRRLGQWKTVKEPDEKLYGLIKIVRQGNKVFLVYSIRKGWTYTYSPMDYDDEGKPKKHAMPFSKDPVVEEIVEEVK